jgi:AcrR family transcriptional regulator
VIERVSHDLDQEASISAVRSPDRSLRLAGEDLGGHRHICALVDGPDNAFELLLPFIREGLEQGERAVHLVDPQSRDAYVARLRSSGIDVESLMASRQLEVLTWTETYLRGGRFNGSAQILLLRRIIREGRDLGFPATRFIGTLEWFSDPALLPDLLQYEARLNELFQRRPDVVVCTYDLNRHDARTIVDVVDNHPVAIVGGRVRTNTRPTRDAARDRILTAASQLFGEMGVQATGIDSLIAAAGVAKATFYRHFPSKDDLVVAWLRDSRTRWFDHVRRRVDEVSADPATQLSAWFDGVAEWLETEGYRGCPYLNLPVEISDPTHPAQPIVRQALDEVEDYLTGLLEAAGYRDARSLAAEVQALTAGSISLSVARQSTASVMTARRAALSLIEMAAVA